VPAIFTFTTTKVQTSTTIEKEDFDLVISSQKEIDNDQDKRISKLEKVEIPDFTDLGNEAIDKTPKSSSSSQNNQKTTSSISTITTPKITSSSLSSNPTIVSKQIRYRTDPANYKIDFMYDSWTKLMKKCTASCTYVIVLRDENGDPLTYSTDFESLEDMKNLFPHSYYSKTYTEIEL
jgi:hypothetical protein